MDEIKKEIENLKENEYSYIYYKTDGHCAFCGIPLSNEWSVVKSKQGPKKSYIGNYLPSCHECNISKADKDLNNFRNKFDHNKNKSYGDLLSVCFSAHDELYKSRNSKRVLKHVNNNVEKYNNYDGDRFFFEIYYKILQQYSQG